MVQKPSSPTPKALKVITFIARRMVYWQKDFSHVLFRRIWQRVANI